MVTKKGSVKALLQIIYGQYFILGSFGSFTFRPKKPKSFTEKRTSYIFPWTRDSKCQNSAYSLARNTSIALWNFSPICLPETKSSSLLKKKLSLISVLKSYKEKKLTIWHSYIRYAKLFNWIWRKTGLK